MSELRGTTKPFTGMQIAVAKNMNDSLKVRGWPPEMLLLLPCTSCDISWTHMELAAGSLDQQVALGLPREPHGSVPYQGLAARFLAHSQLAPASELP